ncbi:FMN-linked oxidoreductase [Melanomma pulvis-pyrius CBS 109.77]|uniref:FMN-linked oxidoreductase n=1 Tax=Melanomma pulvis-pyrius CBS 109.77 TaxID=1314802 RepID=A0A6A6WV32_9PLEO|nr:FMN-linked oxidoreductase [Melanomma pulvis-pyrius CBS 109.77]
MSPSRLFEPLKVGNLALKQRIAMAPLTRFRANDAHVPLPMVAEYYGQRASAPGTLLVSEATFIGPQYGGYPNAPGIYSDEQITAWRSVTDAVHKKGSYIYLQLWALGRVANPQVAAKDGFTVKSSSALRLSEHLAEPVPFTDEDITTTVAAYASAAKNAISAGFDGVEIHGANGYLIDQFLQDKVNQRTDSYGGSIENRSRFAIEVTKAVVEAVGAERTGIRLSPFSDFQGMGMEDPIPQFSDVITKLDALNIAYIHLVSSRVAGNADIEEGPSLAPLVKLFKNPVLVAGGYRAASAKTLVDEEYPEKDIVVVFGRYFISTPDLVFRLKEGIELQDYNRDTFYNAGSPTGYIDYPFSKEWIAAQA